MIRHIYNSVMCLDLSEASHSEKPSGFVISVYLFTDNTKFLKCDQLSQEMNTVNVLVMIQCVYMVTPCILIRCEGVESVENKRTAKLCNKQKQIDQQANVTL